MLLAHIFQFICNECLNWLRHLQYVTTRATPTMCLVCGLVAFILIVSQHLLIGLFIVSASTVLTLVVHVALTAGRTVWRRVLGITVDDHRAASDLAAGDNIEVSPDRRYRQVGVNEGVFDHISALIAAVALSCYQFYRD